MRLPLAAILAALVTTNSQYQLVSAFSGAWSVGRSRFTLLSSTNDDVSAGSHHVSEESQNVGDSRRSVLKKASLVAGFLATSFVAVDESQAAVGTLPEFSDANVILQGVTINVADQSQQDSMISFLKDAFDFQILRQRKAGSTTDTV